MNCKPGDLAVIVRCERSYCKAHLGKIVRCIQLESCDEGSMHWATDPKLYATDDGLEIVWADEVLRPIRDPGDDATDETLTWLPVPSRERETA